jgi:integrase/recombinase XerD
MEKRRVIGAVGPLVGLEAEFRERLVRLGYRSGTVARHDRLLREVSRWLVDHDRDLGGFKPGEFIADRALLGLSPTLTERSLRPLIDFLVDRGLLPRSADQAADENDADLVLLAKFARFLRDERGLGVGTVAGYLRAVGPFVRSRRRGSELDLAGIAAGDVFAFLTAVCPGRSRGAASLTATAMRSLLRWLFLTAVIDGPLAEVVPRVGSWKLAGLVEPVRNDDLTRMIESCDRSSNVGRRDVAMLLVLSRLGLRAGEAAGLGLDDIDWRAGELIVRGKGPKDSRLPLPVDVGEAIADYLRHGRPVSAQGRTVFVRVQAPHRPLTNRGVTQAVFAASQRAGCGTVRAHRLRHTAATRMLAAGGSLFEIGEVLRHQRPVTTAIYAKVDLVQLRTIARPWPQPELAVTS